MWSEKLLSDYYLSRLAGVSTFVRGRTYYHQKRIQLQEKGENFARFIVRGTFPYSVYLEEFEGELTHDCTCPVGQRGEICKHVVAAALYVREHLLENKEDNPHVWKQRISNLMKLPPMEAGQRQPQPYLLIFVLTRSTSYYYSGPRFDLEPRWIPFKRMLKAVGEDTPLPRTPQEWVAWLAAHAGEGRYLLSERLPSGGMGGIRVLNTPPAALEIARVLHRTNRFYSSIAPSVGDLLDLLSEWDLPVYRHPVALSKPIPVLRQGVETALVLQREERGLSLHARLYMNDTLATVRTAETVSSSPPWVLINEKQLVRLPSKGLQAWLEALHTPLFIPKEDEAEFRDRYLPRLIRKFSRPLEGNVVQIEEIAGLEPRPRLYLQELKDDRLGVELRFAYGDHEVVFSPDYPPLETIEDPNDPWKFYHLHRQPELEEQFYKEAATAKYGLKRGTKEQPEMLLLRARVAPVDFLLDKVPKLAAAGFEIFGEENLKNIRVNRHPPSLSVNITSGIDWFDVQAVVKFGDVSVPLAEIKRALRKKRRYVKLADGTIGQLPEEWLARYKRLFGLATETDEENDTLRFADFHAALLDELAEEAEQARADKAFRERLERLKAFQGIEEHPLPQGLRGELRPYQVAGYNWLHFLHDYGFGGILADDMGLGKTVQVLAFLLSLREQGHPQAPDLVVVPRSLLVNWQREVEKFTPDLKVLTYFGPSRPPVEKFASYDLVLTTYGVMRVDAEKLRAYRFHYIVLDESQAIKNPLAKTARVARRLQSEHRLAMTGTPVENNTFELWAQFAFVMPGLLGSLDYFKDEFVKPIEKANDEQTAQTLRKMVYPFILRRTKEQVAPELPPRTERIVYCDMEPAQRRFYLKIRDYYREMLLGLIAEEGLDKSRMKILEGLLRLRQISNHPKLVDPQFHGDSGKMEVLLDTLETLHSEGHKALVFSQFVQMLHLVQAELAARGIPYTYLDGSTRDRQAQVDRFQNDPSVPFFLISLKAGGVGLNLTAADYVIHIDPWWNPAVERQASDRTHRIGQDKPVFIFKLITRDSVEEKILQLQEKKKELVEKLITTEGSFFKDLTPEDVQALFS